MIRFISRLTGFLLIAAGFVALVVDGTRSIASGGPRIASIADSVNWFAPGKLEAARGTIAALHPRLWDPATLWLLALPSGAALGLAGFLLLWLGRPRGRAIGFATR